MAVTLDALSGSGPQAGQITWTWAHTVSGADRLLEVTVGVHATTVASVTYNGVALTFACGTPSDDGEADAEIWHLVAPPTGTHDIIVTLSASNDWSAVGASFNGVDQVTPVGTGVSDGYAASGTSTSHNTVGQADGLIWDVFTLGVAGGTITANGGQNVESAATADASNQTIVTSKPGGASVSTGYSWPNDFVRWSHASIAINPVAGTGPTAAQMAGLLAQQAAGAMVGRVIT